MHFFVYIQFKICSEIRSKSLCVFSRPHISQLPTRSHQSSSTHELKKNGKAMFTLDSSWHRSWNSIFSVNSEWNDVLRHRTENKMGDVHRSGAVMAHVSRRGDDELENQSESLEEKDHENVSKIVRGTTMSRSYR